ncbi:MAG TPA: glycosyltransferase, partial [Acidimicrobiia bacterium]
ADAVIGMRLHAVVMAAAAGVPVVALSYDPKVTSAMSSLGAADMAVSLADVGLVADKAERALSDGTYRTTIAQAARDLANLAALNSVALTEAASQGVRAPRDLVATVAAEFATRQLEARSLLDRTEAELAQARKEINEEKAAHHRLQEDWDHLVGSRSMRVVNSWWAVRNALRRRERASAPSELRASLAAELEQVLDTHRDTPGIVVYPPTIGWSAHLFQRPQQMARAFARMGYLTFYGVDWGGREDVRGFRYAEDRLCLMGLPTEHLSLLQAIPDPLMISYVYNFDFRRHLSNPTTIFEHIDHLDVFAPSYPMPSLQAWYEAAVREAHAVAASARDLLAEVRSLRSDALLCPNGVAYDHFAGYRGNEPPGDLAEFAQNGEPVIGYYGALAEWIDFDLLDHAAREMPEHRFVFVGPDYDGSMKGKHAFERPNVKWLGPKPYEDLPAYLGAFTVATIPFLVSDVTHRVSPLKLFEYMAGGKPVVTTAMRESQNYEPVLIATDPDSWVARLREAEALGRDPAYVASLQRTARANTWEQRVGLLIDGASSRALARRGEL